MPRNALAKVTWPNCAGTMPSPIGPTPPTSPASDTECPTGTITAAPTCHALAVPWQHMKAPAPANTSPVVPWACAVVAQTATSATTSAQVFMGREFNLSPAAPRRSMRALVQSLAEIGRDFGESTQSTLRLAPFVSGGRRARLAALKVAVNDGANDERASEPVVAAFQQAEDDAGDDRLRGIAAKT